MQTLESLGLKPIIQLVPWAPAAERVAQAFSRQRQAFFLDSSARDERLGRYSFIGCDPFLILRSKGRAIELRDAHGWRRFSGDPLDCLGALLAQHAVPRDSYPVPFVAGAVGYLAYDLGRLIEPLPTLAVDDHPDLPDICVAFYDAVVAYDHHQQAAYVISTGLPRPPGPGREAHAKARLAWLKGLLRDATAPDPSSSLGSSAKPPQRTPSHDAAMTDARILRSNFTRESYLRAVEKARAHIITGDCYQVNLSQCFHAPWHGTAWDLYAALRATNPAPFSVFLDLGGPAVISSSPERFLRVSNDVVETRPIKGTRPRGANAAQDISLSQELAASGKDRAEHIMIVDLERNDLGRVSRVGSVSVDELMAVERYATVFHLTSTVRGRLRADRGLADILRATFPGGSITGAPKIRAMQIIEELEPTRRGIYTGAIGYFSANGDLDLNIAIRTIVLHQGMATFQVGGGIVYDSTPEGEYQETLDKGLGLAQALDANWSGPTASERGHGPH